MGLVGKHSEKNFISFGGDGIYAAWQTVNNEPAFKRIRENGLYSGSMKISNSYGWGDVKNGEKIQKILMQFTTNQRSLIEMKKQENSLIKVLDYFEKKLNFI